MRSGQGKARFLLPRGPVPALKDSQESSGPAPLTHQTQPQLPQSPYLPGTRYSTKLTADSESLRFSRPRPAPATRTKLRHV
jgi:hypothetical protein